MEQHCRIHRLRQAQLRCDSGDLTASPRRRFTLAGLFVNFSLTESGGASELEKENAHAPDPSHNPSAASEDKSLAFQAGGEAAGPREEVGLISLQPRGGSRGLFLGQCFRGNYKMTSTILTTLACDFH